MSFDPIEILILLAVIVVFCVISFGLKKINHTIWDDPDAHDCETWLDADGYCLICEETPQHHEQDKAA